MSEDGLLKLAEIATGSIASILAVLKVGLNMWLIVRKDAIAHQAALEKENLELRKAITDRSFDQLKEADKFIRDALTEVALKLRETTAATVAYGNKLTEVQTRTEEQIIAVTKKLESVEVQIQSVIKELPRSGGKLRISGPKFDE